MYDKEHLQHSMPVCQKKIFQMIRYGIVKLSKSNITWQTALKIFLTISFLSVSNHWVVLIKNGLDLEMFFLHNGLSNTPSNSMKFHQFYGTEQNKIFVFRLCEESYIPCHNHFWSHSHKSVSKYFINDLRKNSLNLVSSTTLVCYWRCTLK